MWRAAGVLLMAGRTERYAVDPRGEYVFGVVGERPMLARRGRERRLVPPGRLVAWDPSHAHSGTAVDGAWASRLLVVEAGDLCGLAGDAEPDRLADTAFPEPVLADPALVRGFLRIHAALEAPASRLEQDERLAEWLHAVVEHGDAARSTPRPTTPRDERALRLACDHLREHFTANVGLDELAAVAGVGKFRLVRLFRERTGLPPHALQTAHRVRKARRLLEAGEPIAVVAATTGFADQSHLHRHFRRGLGMTPGEYRRRFRAS
jgi:AraC-like DNA-binding protein